MPRRRPSGLKRRSLITPTGTPLTPAGMLNRPRVKQVQPAEAVFIGDKGAALAVGDSARSSVMSQLMVSRT